MQWWKHWRRNSPVFWKVKMCCSLQSAMPALPMPSKSRTWATTFCDINKAITFWTNQRKHGKNPCKNIWWSKLQPLPRRISLGLPCRSSQPRCRWNLGEDGRMIHSKKKKALVTIYQRWFHAEILLVFPTMDLGLSPKKATLFSKGKPWATSKRHRAYRMMLAKKQVVLWKNRNVYADSDQIADHRSWCSTNFVIPILQGLPTLGPQPTVFVGPYLDLSRLHF